MLQLYMSIVGVLLFCGWAFVLPYYLKKKNKASRTSSQNEVLQSAKPTIKD